MITSVTDSGHGRPLSIVRDGEESADDLDESHASYSDVSYSRTTDIDHDQESTASEDTLNISAHEPANIVNAEDGTHINHNPATHHPLHQTITRQPSAEGSHTSIKPTVQQDAVAQILQNTSSTPTTGSSSITNNNLQKQNSASLESPQELPHDNSNINGTQEEKSNGADSVVGCSFNSLFLSFFYDMFNIFKYKISEGGVKPQKPLFYHYYFATLDLYQAPLNPCHPSTTSNNEQTLI